MSAGPFIEDGELFKPGFTPGTKFDKDFNAKIKDFPPTMGIALVDLTDGVPRYAVNKQEHKEKHVFSLAKIAPMLAAFRLQERLRSSFSRESAEDIEKAWRQRIKAKAGKFGDSFPKLDRIFEAPAKGNNWSFDFRETKADWRTLEAIEDGHKDEMGAIPKAKIDALGFLDRMKLMVRMSDDNAAGSVISDLGFPFIHATLVNEGLYDPDKHGLWVGSSYSTEYASTVYVVEPTGDNISVGATAYSVALFMTRLIQKKLVKDYGKYTPSQDMLDIMEELSSSNIGTGSRFLITGGLTDGDVAFSKIGMDIFDKGRDSRDSEGAVIERTMTTKKGHPKRLRYVAVALQAPHEAIMPKVIRVIDDYVEEVHFLDD
jgi:hypothetical protein